MNTSIDELRIGETTFQSDAFFRSGQKTGKINPITNPALLDHITTNADRNDAIMKAIAEQRITDPVLLAYITRNADRNDAIMKTIAEQSLTEPAQIDAYLAGNRTALLEGAL
jgi:hypothetical protein